MGPGELSPRWRGVHHLALVTPDMDATVRFWCGALGARLVATVATESFRHYFFEFGPGSTIAFFEYQGVDLDFFAKPAGVPTPQAPQFDHLSLALPDEDALRGPAGPAEGGRLRGHRRGRPRLPAVDLLLRPGRDRPRGVVVGDRPDRPRRPTTRDSRLFADPDPVPAVAELRARGEVDSIPATRLVDEVTRDLYKTGP